MGSRGSFLESGGFSTPAQWHTVDYVDGIKVLEPKDPTKSISLPERSNTPGTAYISYRKNEDKTFSQLRVFGKDRVPEFDIDYLVVKACFDRRGKGWELEVGPQDMGVPEDILLEENNLDLADFY